MNENALQMQRYRMLCQTQGISTFDYDVASDTMILSWFDEKNGYQETTGHHFLEKIDEDPMFSEQTGRQFAQYLLDVIRTGATRTLALPMRIHTEREQWNWIRLIPVRSEDISGDRVGDPPEHTGDPATRIPDAPVSQTQTPGKPDASGSSVQSVPPSQTPTQISGAAKNPVQSAERSQTPAQALTGRMSEIPATENPETTDRDAPPVTRVVGSATDIMRSDNSLFDKEDGIDRTSPVQIGILSDPVLSMVFDLRDGKRISFSGDREPEAFRGCQSLPSFFKAGMHCAHPQDLTDIFRSGYHKLQMDTIYRPGKNRQVDLRLLDVTEKPENIEPPDSQFFSFYKDSNVWWEPSTHFEVAGRRRENAQHYRWYRLIYTSLDNPSANSRWLFISLYDIDEAVREQEHFLNSAKRDPITGLHTRTSFEYYCGTICKNIRSLENELNAILMIEIDDFHHIIRTHSLHTGDHIRGQMSRLLKPYLQDDRMAVSDNDTWLAVFHHMLNMDDIRNRMNVIQENLKVVIDDGQVVTVSIGAAICLHDKGCGYRSAVEYANKALYQAQKNGGNQAVLYTTPSTESHSFQGKQSFTPVMPDVVPGRNIYIRAFGNFTVYVDGRPVIFRNEKSREYLAYLVDRRGPVSTAEAISVLWEDEPASDVTRARLRKVVLRLRKTLEASGVGDIIQTVGRKRYLDTSRIRCDFYDYIAQKPECENLFHGSYMPEYSWAESTLLELEEIQHQAELKNSIPD